MNNFKIMVGVSLVILTAAYAFSTFNPAESDAKPNVSKADQPPPQLAPPAASQNAQAVLIAPPSRDKPTDESLAVKEAPRKTPRMAPPPPIAPGDKTDARHQQDIGHGHPENQTEADDNRPAPPKGANH